MMAEKDSLKLISRLVIMLIELLLIVSVINGRNDANNSFEPITVFTRPGATGHGMVGIGFQNKTAPVTLAAHLHIKNDDY